MVVSGVWLVVGDGVTLIETATSLAVPLVLEAVREIGFAERDIKHAILTHIHLDHGGGTGNLLQRLPHMRVYVHERGVRHVIDPSILLESAKVLYGTMEAIMAIHGDILPIPKENVIPVLETEIDIGAGVRLKTVPAPGHAPHHICIFEPDTGAIFTGEAFGHYYPEYHLIGPAVAPPSFDYEASKNTIRQAMALDPKTICFSQYGPYRDPSAAAQMALDRLDSAYEKIKDGFDRGLSTKRIVSIMSDQFLKGMDADNHEAGTMIESLVLGYEFYFRKKGLIS